FLAVGTLLAICGSSNETHLSWWSSLANQAIKHTFLGAKGFPFPNQAIKHTFLGAQALYLFLLIPSTSCVTFFIVPGIVHFLPNQFSTLIIAALPLLQCNRK
ncbi:hypothetical protein HAX54_000797, partial [Datura stramonium]|nr:hypothetical protein [Datura stramonium]